MEVRENKIATVYDLGRMCRSFDECFECPFYDVVYGDCGYSPNRSELNNTEINKWLAEHSEGEKT